MDVDMGEKSKSRKSTAASKALLDTTMTMESLEDEPSLQPYKDLFSTLDAQKLEILSLTEHDRILSSSRHMEIADAMEEVLAQPSVRKEKSRARRLSRLGRIAGRRISIVPIAHAALPSLMEDDLEWDEDEADDDVAPLPRESAVDESLGIDRDSFGTPLLLSRASTGKLPLGRRSSSLTRTSLTRDSLTRGAPVSASKTRPLSAGGRRPSAVEQKHHVQLKLQQKKIVADNVLRLVLHSRVLPIAALRGVLRNVSSSWRSITNMYGRVLVLCCWKRRLYPLTHWRCVFHDGSTVHTRGQWQTRPSTFSCDGSCLLCGLLVFAGANIVIRALLFSSQSRKSMIEVYKDYPRGHYLSDGAYKEVHKVFSTRHKRLEAISVMDIGAIESTGNQVRNRLQSSQLSPVQLHSLWL